MDRDSSKGGNNKHDTSKSAVCTNKQLVIYEYLNKAQNLMVNNSETLLSKFIYFAKSMEEMRKKWIESENKCRDLEDKLKIEKSMCQRKINELKIDVETHYEKRLQAESKSDRLQIDLEKMQDQFQMFATILKDKQYDDNDRMNFFSNYASTNQMQYQKRDDYHTDFRLSRAIEDTGSIISDYTEDDIDVPNDDDDHYKEHNENIFTPVGHKHTVNAMAPSTASLPCTDKIQNRRSNGTKRNQRHSASLTREGDKREKKRRTRSNNAIQDTEVNINTSEIKTITTVKLDPEGRPLTVTSQLHHGSSEHLQMHTQTNKVTKNGNIVELAFVPARTTKTRKKRPSREFLQRSVDESETNTEDSEIFWNGGEVVDETANGGQQTLPNGGLINVMTPIVEAPTPTNNRTQSCFKGGQGTPALSKIMSKNFSAGGAIPLARKYKRSHLFKAQVILNSELCAHCDKRTKFGKMVMKCRECDLVVHTECKDMLQRPCYPAFNFPTQGKIHDYVLADSPQIPPILQMVVNEIEHRGIVSPEVGLYRVNGSDSQIKHLKEKLIKRHQMPDLRKISDVHVLCSFVKDFLNNLNEHLVTYESWYRFTKACELQNEIDRISTLEEAIMDLPDANRDTLSFIVLHLQRISETPECKMPISNLARVFGQSIVGNSSPNAPNVDIINEVRMQHQVVENLIKIPSLFYQSFIDGSGDQNQYRLFRNSAKTPETMKKSRTAVVLSSILGPASNNQQQWMNTQQGNRR